MSIPFPHYLVLRKPLWELLEQAKELLRELFPHYLVLRKLCYYRSANGVVMADEEWQSRFPHYLVLRKQNAREIQEIGEFPFPHY